MIYVYCIYDSMYIKCVCVWRFYHTNTHTLMCRFSVNNMKRLKLIFAHPTLVRHNKNADPIPAKSFAKWQVPAFHPCWNGAWLSSWVNGFNPSNHLNPWQEFQPTLSGMFSSHVVFEGDDPIWQNEMALKLSTIINLCILLSTSSRLVLVTYAVEFWWERIPKPGEESLRTRIPFLAPDKEVWFENIWTGSWSWLSWLNSSRCQVGSGFGFAMLVGGKH